MRERVPAAEHGGEHGVGLPLRERLGGGRVLRPPCGTDNTAVISLEFAAAWARRERGIRDGPMLRRTGAAEEEDSGDCIAAAARRFRVESGRGFCPWRRGR